MSVLSGHSVASGPYHTPTNKVFIVTNHHRLEQCVAGEGNILPEIFDVLPEVFNEFRSRLRKRHGLHNLVVGRFRPRIKIFVITNHLRLPEHVLGEIEVPDIILDALPDVFDVFQSRCPQPHRRNGDRRH
jgi:hypothetical protein